MSSPRNRTTNDASPNNETTGRDYDRAYFDKWYRSPRHRVKSAIELSRQVDFVLHAAEWVLGRRIKSVLDVGSGEGNWRAPLKRRRPKVAYTGVDPSEYAVERFGKRRNIRLGSFGALSAVSLAASYDLVVCCGMLNYVNANVLRDGLLEIGQLTGGLAYLELFTRNDATEGDTNWPRPKTATWYRSALANAGMVSVGLHCYVPGDKHPIAELERTI